MGSGTLKRLIKAWLPPAIVSLGRRWGLRSAYKGNYHSWQEAVAHSSGYDADEIFRRVGEASLKVKNGDAVFERDAVCFYHEEYNWEVVAGLLLGAIESGALNVLDFGGALGSSYFQHKKLISGLKGTCWGIVEQRHYVEYGRNEFENGELRFYLSVEECFEKMPVNTVLLSSVLQYLESPYDLLAKLKERNAAYIVIDRTPFSGAHDDVITVQRVPASIYPASLPCRVFSKQKMVACLSGRYEIIAEFQNSDGRGIAGGKSFDFSGMIFRRK